MGRYKSGIVLNLADLLDEKQSASDLLKAATRVESAIEVDVRNLSNPMYSRRWLVIEAHQAAKKSQQ